MRKKMEHLQSCINFFNECLSFKEKQEDFEIASEMLGCEIDELDPKSLKQVIENYVNVKKELSELCHLKLCKHEDMDSDDDDDDDTDTDDDTDMETTDDDTDDTDSDVDNDQDIQKDMEEDKKDEDDSILFKQEMCCWEKILAPFNDALKENKTARVMLRNAEDEMEDQYMRLNKCFKDDEKNLCAKLLQEICYKFDNEGAKYFKTCPSAHVKSLVCYCKDKIKTNVLEEMFGDHYKLLIDENEPLAKKRKVFKNDENIDQLINYLKVNTLPAINEYIKNKQMEFIEKYT